MAVLNPLYWGMSEEELNELSLQQWKKQLSDNEKKTEDKMRAIANNLIDTILFNHGNGKLKTVK